MLAAATSWMTARLIHASRGLFTYEPHQIETKEVVGVLIVALLCGFHAEHSSSA